jgi:putative ABC transport system permease protein
MIGVITLISVQERTKEIGILRAIGASKRDVSSMFNAETIIIGLAAGLLGVIVTYLFCIPINIILHSVTGIPQLSAKLPILAAGILVFISMLLTLISGLIPSRSAAKKDPVVALRTE